MQTNEPKSPASLPHRTLGKTGVSVPLIGFGTAACGIRRDIKNGVALYEAAYAAGITYFDSAPSQGGYGRAQQQLGVFQKNKRDKIFLVTKCHENDGEAALRQLDANLREMQTDHADLVYVHSLGDLDPDEVMAKNGALPALLKAKQEGRTRFVGLSGHCRVGNFVKVLKSDYAKQIDVVMLAMNFADRFTYNFEERVVPLCQRAKIGVIAMKVYGGANWSARTMSNSLMPDENREMALRYGLSIPGVDFAVVGMATEAELTQNLQWARAFKPLTRTERDTLSAPGRKLAGSWGAHFGPTD